MEVYDLIINLPLLIQLYEHYQGLEVHFGETQNKEPWMMLLSLEYFLNMNFQWAHDQRGSQDTLIDVVS